MAREADFQDAVAQLNCKALGMRNLRRKVLVVGGTKLIDFGES